MSDHSPPLALPKIKVGRAIRTTPTRLKTGGLLVLNWSSKQINRDNAPPENTSCHVNDSFSNTAPVTVVASGERKLDVGTGFNVSSIRH